MQDEVSTASTKVKGIPDNSSIIMPRLICKDPGAEIDFCAEVFEAKVLNRRPGPDGTVWHGLLTIREEMLMIEAEVPGLPGRGPALDGTSPVMIFVYVSDVDRTIELAIQRGAKVILPAKNQFWGDRSAVIMDPGGHVWTVASRVEETTVEERADRWSRILRERKPD
jgi:PhnB protein